MSPGDLRSYEGHTKSCKYPRRNAIRLPNKDGQVRIVPFDSWVGGLDETPENGWIRQRHRCIFVERGATDRVPAEAGEV